MSYYWDKQREKETEYKYKKPQEKCEKCGFNKNDGDCANYGCGIGNVKNKGKRIKRL